MYFKQVKLFITLLLCLFFNSAWSQNDIIHTTKGEEIICNIIKEDSSNVYFKVGGSLSTVEASLNRSQISSIQYAPKNAPKLPPMMQSPGQVERDDYVAPTNTAIVSPTKEPPSSPQKQNSFSIHVGISSPTGNFKKTKLDTNDIGPGKTGQIVSLQFTHMLKKNFGIFFNGFFSNNELNSVPLTTKYKYNTDSTWTAGKANWQSFGASVGLMYYKEFKDISFFGKINGGYLSLKYPPLSLSMHSVYTLNYQTVTSDAVSFGGGIGFGYKLFEDLNAIFEVDYLQATCKYNEVLIIGEQPGVTVPQTVSITKRDVKQTYQNIFITLGLSYSF